MRNHSGTFSRHCPTFDSLEERSLLSGGNSWSAGPGPGNAAPTSPPGVLQPPPMGGPRSGGASSFRGNWSLSPDQTGSWQFAQISQDQSDLTVPPTTGYVGPGPSGPPQVGLGALGSQANTSAGSGSPGPGLAKNTVVVMDSEPGGPAVFNAQVASAVVGVTTGSNKEAGQEPGGASNSQIGSSVSSPPAQFLALLDADIFGTARRLSPGNADSGSESPDVTGPGREANGGVARLGSLTRNRAPLVATTYVSAHAPTGNQDELPRPSGADLIANALPFDRAALDRAIDRLFQQFETLSPGELIWQRPARLVLYSLAMASTFAAIDALRRRWGRGRRATDARVRDPETMLDQIGFPELPGSWSSRLS
jgi:hypothetical protein